MRLGQFGKIGRNQCGRSADGQAEDDAEDDQGPVAQRETGAQRADDEDDGRDQQQLATAQGIGQRTDERRAEHRAEQHRADDPSLLPFAKMHLLLNEQNSSGNHTRVVAEQQATQRAEEIHDTLRHMFHWFLPSLRHAILRTAHGTRPCGTLREPTTRPPAKRQAIHVERITTHAGNRHARSNNRVIARNRCGTHCYNETRHGNHSVSMYYAMAAEPCRSPAAIVFHIGIGARPHAASLSTRTGVAPMTFEPTALAVSIAHFP